MSSSTTSGEGRPAPRSRRDREDEFFGRVAARMPERSQRVIETLRRVRQVYVPCGRDEALRVGFDRFLERFIAGRTAIREEADIYFLIGESGAGKSSAIGRLLRGHPALQTQETSFGPITPYASVKLRGFTTPRLAAKQIIQAAGYGVVDDERRGELWDRLPQALADQFVFLVHIDEAQHLMRENATVREQRELANAFKGASIDQGWPIAFVFSGLPEVMKVPSTDQQVERRGDFTLFTDVRMPDERDLVANIMLKMAEPADIAVRGLLGTDLPERLAHAARYRYARICQLVLSAIQEGLHKGADTLTVAHFAKAYERRPLAFGRPDINPFLSPHWYDLQSGSFLELPEDDE